MAYLLIVSLIWAFSFGLIKDNLRGLDATFVALVRMTLSAMFFAPMLRFKAITAKLASHLMLLGAVQYGLMYILYIAAFRYLDAHVIALFTVFTPIFVVLLDNVFERVFRPGFLAAALFAVVAAAIIGQASVEPWRVWKGFLLVQGSNLCFALGQVWYRRLEIKRKQASQTFGFTYLGAVIITSIATAMKPEALTTHLSFSQIATLLYLGVIASGVCFFLWNLGATRTNAAVLAVMNNVKIPLAVIVSLVVFGETTDLVRLLLAAALMALALWISHRVGEKSDKVSDKLSQTQARSGV